MLRAPVPVRLVVVDDGLSVRTWHRRDTGWYGRTLRARRGRARVPGLEVDVDVTDVGAEDPALRERVDAAYRAAYGSHGPGAVDGMVTDASGATTLRLDPSHGALQSSIT